MDIVRIFNGLGNQMSQYAFYLAKKKAHPLQTSFITNKYESENIHNGYELARVFGIRSCRLKESISFHIMQSMYTPVWGYRFFGSTGERNHSSKPNEFSIAGILAFYAR